MCLCFTQAVSQNSVAAPSSSKARLEELVMRQSKQLIPVVASSSSRDKAKGKGSAASGPKHGPLAAPGTGSGTGTAMSRSKAGIDGTKRGEEAPSGTHMKAHAKRLPVVTQPQHAKANLKVSLLKMSSQLLL